MVNEQDKLTVSGIDYYLIPGYAPLAISRCGLCINVETMRNRKWTGTTRSAGKNKWLTFSTAIGSMPGRTITLSRALALCFIPIPKEFQHISVEKLSAIYREKVTTLEEASNIKNILWVKHTAESIKRSVTLRNLITGEKTEHESTSAGGRYLKVRPTTLGSYFSEYGPHFKYKHYQVSVAFDEGEDFSHCKKQKVS